MKKLLEKLNKKHKDSIEFKKASREVFLGSVKLKPNSSKSFGPSVSVSTGAPYKPDPKDLVTGKKIAVGSAQKLKFAELRCFKKDGAVRVGLYRNDDQLGMELAHMIEADDKTGEYDEGLFTWFSPLEYIGTPWSDNDPYICQVISVEFLREWGNTIKD